MKKENSRRITKTVQVGSVAVGSNHPVSVQSMTKTKTENIPETINQILELEENGCEIIRCTANSEEAAFALKKIKQAIHIPLVADIHFNHKLALIALESGVDKIRINPGNIGDKQKIKTLVNACKERGVPIRIGVNSGSLEKDILEKYQYPTAEAMVESALRHITILEDLNFTEILISMKSSNAILTMDAYRLLATKVNYPFHTGVTEAGAGNQGIIRSTLGIGTLLAEGIGDTIRVSLTENCIEEVRVGKEILRSLQLTSFGVNIISCPTCGRLEADLFSIVKELENRTGKIKKPLDVAVMGCVVNGPGEAKDADVGISIGKGHAVLYADGQSRGMVEIDQAVNEMMKIIEEKI